MHVSPRAFALPAIIAAAALSLGLFAGSAGAAKPGEAQTGPNKLQCFQDLGGTCTLGKGGNTATFDNAGPYSGAEVRSKVSGASLAEVDALTFTYTGVAGAGAPRFSLPVDTDGDGATDAHVFIAASYCNDGAGLVDAVNDPTCAMQLGSETFDNWDALVAAHPEYTIDSPFIVADETGEWTVGNVRVSA